MLVVAAPSDKHMNKLTLQNHRHLSSTPKGAAISDRGALRRSKDRENLFGFIARVRTGR